MSYHMRHSYAKYWHSIENLSITWLFFEILLPIDSILKLIYQLQVEILHNLKEINKVYLNYICGELLKYVQNLKLFQNPAIYFLTSSWK